MPSPRILVALAVGLFLPFAVSAGTPCGVSGALVAPERPPLPAAELDGLGAALTVSQLVAALGPAQLEHCAAPRHCLEWLFDDRRGLGIEFEDVCRRPLVVRREAMHSRRQAEVAARAGLWHVPEDQVAALNARAKALGLQPTYSGSDPFYFDGQTVALHLTPFFSEQAMAPGRPADDIYRVVTRWQGEDLYWLTPQNPRWVFLARFRDGRFEEDYEPEKHGPEDQTWTLRNGEMVPVPHAPPKGLGVVTWRFERLPVEQAGEYMKALARDRGVWNYALYFETGTIPPRPW